jgi:hypothetical protein
MSELEGSVLRLMLSSPQFQLDFFFLRLMPFAIVDFRTEAFREGKSCCQLMSSENCELYGHLSLSPFVCIQ